MGVFVTTAHTGNLSELKVMAQYVERGYNVAIPFGLAKGYDFVVEKNGRYVKVQVKTGTLQAQGRELHAYSQKPYTQEDTDIVVVFDPHCEAFYYIPVAHIDENSRVIRLRLEPYIYNVKTERALPGNQYLKFIG